MGQLVGIWQGHYGEGGTFGGAPSGQPGWSPTEGVTYLVQAQSTIATSGSNEYTVGVSFAIEDSNGPLVQEQSETKVASGGPSTAPMVYITWACPIGWSNGDVSISATPLGHSPHLSAACNFSIVVVEIEQPEPEM